MRLNHSTDLALRVLMLTATRGDLVTIRDLATALTVPEAHLAKIVQRLQRLGLVITVRGRAGGVQLAPDARARPVGTIVGALEGTGEVVSCDDPPCTLRGACRLRGALRRAQEAFLASLDDVTLADLVAGPSGPLLLSLGPPPTG
jgi:Rrf2 family nitric oxide-sensitive transcriptional repressor